MNVAAKESKTRSRDLHFVGTLPQFASATDALTWQRDSVAERTRLWFGGETGDRSQWIVAAIKRLHASDKVRTVRHGSWTGYDDVERVAVRRGHHITPADIPLRIAEDFLAEREALQSVLGQPASKPLQVGIPGFLDMALFSFGPRGVPRHARTFRRALSREITSIDNNFPGEVVFQLEIPVALIAVASAPRPLQSLIARFVARFALAQVRAAPAGSRFGVHLCLGDLGHRALRQLKDSNALAALTTALVRQWPSHTTFEFVHMPFSGGEQPPSRNANFYRPLQKLRTIDIPIIAGIAHEQQSLLEQQEALAIVERQLGRPVGIATSCGLGRRTQEAALAAVSRMTELAES